MNAILSLVLSLILAFSGGAMPAVPETATTYTLGNIVLTVQDETIVLNPSLKLTTAAGSEQVQAQFGVELGEETLLPLAGELTGSGVKFMLGEGRAYALDAATLNELIGMTEPDAETAASIDAVVQEFTDFAALIPALYSESFNNYEANFALSEEMYAHWAELSGASPESFEVDVNGVSVPVTCVELNLTAQDILSSLDLLHEKGSPAMKAYLQKMLDLYSMLYGVEAPSFSEFFTLMITSVPDESGAEAAEAMELTMPIELTYGSKDGLYYVEEIVNTEMDGIGMDVSAVNVYQDGANEMVMSMTMGNEELTMNMGGAGVYDLSGNVDFNFDLTAEMADQAVLDFLIGIDRAVAEDGLAETNVVLDIEVFEKSVNLETDESVTTKTTVSIGWTASPRFEEDGSVSTDCALTINGTDGVEDFNAALSFVFNRAEAPFADAFEGMEVVQLPADTENEAYQMLGSELFGLAADLMTLSMDESVMELISLFEVQSGVLTVTEEVAPADEYAGIDDPAILNEEYLYTDDPAFIDEEYLLDDIYYEEAYDYPEYTFSAYDGGEVDFAAAAEAYGSELKLPAAPEGYALTWLYASPEYCSADYSSDEAYISLSCSPVYDYSSHTMQLGADGSLTALETPTAQVQLNEDGSMLYIDLIHNGFTYSLYVDGVPDADVQAMIAAIMG